MLTFSQFISEAVNEAADDIKEDHHEGGGTWYHGTARHFDSPDFKGADYLKQMGKHGSGFYLSADPKVANSYATARNDSKSKQYGKHNGVGPHVKTYEVHPHKTFNLEREHSVDEKRALVDKIHKATGHPIPHKKFNKYLFNGPSPGHHVHVLLRDMHPGKDANALLHAVGYDSVSGRHGDSQAPELAILHPKVLKPKFA